LQNVDATDRNGMDSQANVFGGLPECRLLRPEDAAALGRLFERLRTHRLEKFFNPHPMTEEEALKRVAYTGKNAYCVLQVGTELVGYGLLRGWDEGYETPSLGIVIDPERQGRGHGRRLMEFLHEIARGRGARRIRLHVHPENVRAVKLYQSLGYVFDGGAGAQWVGFLELNPAVAQPRRVYDTP
jgi:ribosomal protein S18 acetylase RimI-like enzyme